jgi:hypothetical protein
MSVWSDRLHRGVIRDARGRHWRERRHVLVALLLAVVVALGIYGLVGGGGSPRYGVPSPGQVTGSLRSLLPADYHFWVTPGLSAGAVSLSFRVQFTPTSVPNSGTSWGSDCHCDNYPGPMPTVGIGPVAIARPPAVADPNQLLFVAGNVAAVRVGDIGTVGARTAPGLPPGINVAAFQVPQPASPQPAPRSGVAPLNSSGLLPTHIDLRNSVHTLPLIALDANGHAIPSSGTVFPGERTTSQGGACAVSSTLAGLTLQTPTSVTVIKPIPASQSGVFLSCLDDALAFGGTRLQVAILLNAHHPGKTPAALWGSSAVPGHPGLVAMRPPPQFGFNVDTGAPLLARRAGNAWLVVEGRPGLTPAPSTTQRIQVLESIRITRLDLRP